MIIVFIADATGPRKYGVHKFFWEPGPKNRMIGMYSRQTLATARYALEYYEWPKASINRLLKLAKEHPVQMADIA